MTCGVAGGCARRKAGIAREGGWAEGIVPKGRPRRRPWLFPRERGRGQVAKADGLFAVRTGGVWPWSYDRPCFAPLWSGARSFPPFLLTHVFFHLCSSWCAGGQRAVGTPWPVRNRHAPEESALGEGVGPGEGDPLCAPAKGGPPPPKTPICRGPAGGWYGPWPGRSAGHRARDGADSGRASRHAPADSRCARSGQGRA